MTGETDLNILLQKMKPELHQGEYVFTNVENTDNISREDIICEFKEAKGTTVIIEREKADSIGLNYEVVTSWITLNIHSSLEAVGFTAAFSTALAKQNISCNVIAGYYHDHIFVKQINAKKAMAILKSLSIHHTD